MLLLNLDGPETLGALGLVCAWSVVVALVGIGFRYTKGEQRHGEEFECVFERGAIGDFGEEGVLLASFCVRF